MKSIFFFLYQKNIFCIKSKSVLDIFYLLLLFFLIRSLAFLKMYHEDILTRKNYTIFSHIHSEIGTTYLYGLYKLFGLKCTEGYQIQQTRKEDETFITVETSSTIM